MSDRYRYIGKILPRSDGADIVSGKTQYVDDLPMTNLLNGKVLRSPHPHAIIKHIDISKARELNGVKGIVTWETIDDWVFGNPPIFRVLDSKVRYVGDAVALVAAESESMAEEALRAIDVEYEVLPPVFDEFEAMKPDAPQLYSDLPGNRLPVPGGELPFGEPIFGPKQMKGIAMGDMEKGFAEADAVAEGQFVYAHIPNPIPMESPVAIASWEDPARVIIWASQQSVWINKMNLSLIFGEQVDVRVIGHPCGGSFGSKIMSWQIQCYAAALSKSTRQPVRVSFSKEEHLNNFILRPATHLTGRVGMKKDGTVTAISGDWVVGTGYYSMMTQAQLAVGCGEAQIAIRCQNWDVNPKLICTNRCGSGAVRGFGGQELKCALIPLVSLAMEKLELDPFEVLKKNFVKPGDGYFWRNGHWYDYRGIDYSKAMDEGAATFGWQEKWKGWLTPTEIDGPRRIGVGVGVHGNADIGEDNSEAYVKIDENGRVVLYSGLAEHGTGQGSNTIKAVAEILKVPLDVVSITVVDSQVVPVEWGPTGSRGSYAILGATIAAAEDAKRKLLELAAPVLGDAVENLETLDRMVWSVNEPEKKMDWRQILHLRTVMGHGRYEPDYTLSNCMMSFVEVAVDTRTGKVDLLRVVNATDVGKIIDPQGIQGQLNGCLGASGIDSAIFEETVIDRKSGHMLNSNLIDYKWRTSLELPVIDNVILENPMPSNRFGAVGVGEISTSPGPSAILMAASNAIGHRLHTYPVTPEKILKTLGKIESDHQGEGEQ